MREIVAGDQLDRYELSELLAKSGMASIFKAKDAESGEVVALKIPYLQFESDVVFFERFRREEEIGKKLDNPHVVKVREAGKKSRMYMVMEYVEGTSLRAMMHGKKSFSIEKAVDIAKQLCEALVYLHAHGVVHRDIKPENILVTPDGQIKILDFGIAMDESARRLTWTGLSSTMGTPDYMAPEQVSGRRGDVRTDVYAAGTLLYEMLAAELPFSGANVYGMLKAKTNDEPDPLSKHVPTIDPSLEEIVMHAIARSPRDRYTNAADLLDDLRDPSRVKPGTWSAAPRRPTLGLPFRLPRGLAMGLVLVLVLGLLMLLIWKTSHNAPRRGQPSYSPREEVK